MDVIRQSDNSYSFTIMPKGRTLFVAIDTGLLDGDQSKDENDLFRLFWGRFVSQLREDAVPDHIKVLDIGAELSEETVKKSNDTHKVLDKERPENGHKGGQEYKSNLKAVFGFFIGGVLGALLTALGFALFVL